MKAIVLVCLAWIVAPAAVTAVHEAGHLVAALVAGARPAGMIVGPFGGGRALFDGSLGTAGEVWVLAAGLLANLATGAVALAVSRRARAGSPGGILAAIVGGTSLVGAAAYVFVGVTRNVGDPGWIASLLDPGFFSLATVSRARLGLSLVAALACIGATWIAARGFARHQDARWPAPTSTARVLRAVLLVTPLLAIAALRGLVLDPSGAMRQSFSTGPVDNRHGLAWATVAMGAAMLVTGGLAAARSPVSRAWPRPA
jgi:hypothetical protein